jgi:indolepyruvate ferredoxin oxidoreductase beta subunit
MVDMARRCSRRAIFADFTAIAAQAQAPLNAVLLGAVAASGVLPISQDAFRAAIRAEGKAVDANLRGFEAGSASGADIPPQRPALPQADAARATHEAFQQLEAFAADGRPVIAEGVARLTDYQDATFANRYLARLNRFAGRPGAEGPFLRELARHLALRMSVEDVIRVAQLKLRRERVLRVTHEARARPGDIVDITEYLKPGPQEILGLLPPRLGRWALARMPPDLAWPLRVTTTRFSGFLRLKALSALKGWRPYTLGFAEEEAWVEHWLNLIDRALALSPAAALEVVATAALVRGYADTYKRGLANWGRIVECIIEPMLAGQLSRAHFADAVLQARLAATKDPEGEALAQTIAAIRRSAACEHAAGE